MDAKIVFFDQKYILYVSLRPLGLIWVPRELKNRFFGYFYRQNGHFRTRNRIFERDIIEIFTKQTL